VKSAIPFPSVKSGRFVVPTNEPLNEPVTTAPVNVKPAIVVAVVPKSTSVDPSVTLSFVSAEFGIPDKFASTTLIPPEATLIVVSAAFTAKFANPAPASKPFPANEPESTDTVTPDVEPS